MKKNILLVEPPYKSAIIPYALQKFASHHLRRGNEVYFTHNPQKEFRIINNVRYNLILVSSVFTYYGQTAIDTINFLQQIFPKTRIRVGGIFPSLLPEEVEKQTGIKPHIGLYPRIDNELPDFTSFPNITKGFVVTSRGCINKCAFCAVKSIEPKFHILQNWKKQIQHIYDSGIRHLNIQDNNFLATPKSHQKAVIEFLSTMPRMTIDFNQALEAKLFKPFHAKLFKKIRIPFIRFAFDGMHEDGYFQNAVKLVRKYKKYERVVSYLLYNFNDTPEDLWYRIVECARLNCSFVPLKYLPINSMNKKYVGKHWKNKTLIGFNHLLRNACISGTKTYALKDMEEKKYYEEFGSTAEEFKSMISNHNPRTASSNTFMAYVENKHLLNSGLGIINDDTAKEIINYRKKTKRKYKPLYGSNIRQKGDI